MSTILASDYFTSSKRYPAFLTHVVEKTLAGEAAELKERSIGMDVFHRRPDFDTSSDTVVRFTAGEVRKRLGAIYQDSHREQRVQIELPLGSYVPEFFYIAKDGLSNNDVNQIPALQPPVNLQTPMPQSVIARTLSLSKYLIPGLACLLLTVASIGFWHTREANAMKRFWKPVLETHSPVIVAAGAFVFSPSNPLGRVLAEKNDDYPYVSMATAGSIANLTQWFGESKTMYSLQSSVATSISDMREHPTILLGAYNNDWTLRLANELRFRFSPRPLRQIYDSQNPSKFWNRPGEMPAYKDADDYAIVARFKDKLTENTVVILAGLGQNGTTAASQFATSGRYIEMLNQQAPKGWARKNIEIVLKIPVIDGKTGSPIIETMVTW